MTSLPLLLLQAALAVGPVRAVPGEKVSGYIPVPAGTDSATRIPVSVIQGLAPGPVLALVAGTHGAEVAPVVALQRLRARIDPRVLRGTLILVHVANMPSFVHRTIYRNPWDQKNLNRVYPGDAGGTVTERIADLITREVIDKSDFLVDMHAGDGNESLTPFTYWNKLGLDPRVDSVAREMAIAWGNPHIYIDTSRPTDLRASVYTQNTAHLRGKASITTETGYLGVPAAAMVTRNVDGATRLMQKLGMLPGRGAPLPPPIWIDRADVLTADVSGTWHARVDRGATVAAGDVIGRITDYFGNPSIDVRAPFAGTVLYVIGSPAITKGEPVADIGHVRGTAAPAGGPDTVTFTSGALTLHGVVYKPAGAGPFPAIMYSHGSGSDYTREAAALGPFFARHGIVFFMPYRRGSGLSKDAAPYILDVLDSVSRASGIEARSARMAASLTGEHLDDAIAGVAWLRSRPFVDAGRVAAGGNSFGGIVSSLLASRDIGLRAAINSAGAAQTWGASSHLRAALLDAARQAQVPVLLMQAENDYDLTPSREISAAMTAAGKANDVQFFPPFGTTTAEGHSFGYFGSLIWGDSVLAWLRAHWK
ncbi:MAG: succinylglutamate desuccinylase/aspartoacylase family protein [Gemmatimonadaceae bacterium]